MRSLLPPPGARSGAPTRPAIPIPSAILGVLVAVALGSGPGCAPARQYLADRGRDAAQVVTFEAGVGPGLAVDVKATELAHLGAGYADVHKVSLRGGELRTLRDVEVGLPTSAVLSAGALNDGRGARAFHLHANLAEALADRPFRRADVEVGVALGFFSIRVGFSPGELLDLIAGLFGFDPAEDDLGPPSPEPADPGRWLQGDLHAHCDPPDGDHAPIAPEAVVALARRRGLDFVALTPHLWARPTPDATIPPFVEAVRALAARGDAPRSGDPVVLAGFEVTGHPDGHFNVIFRDVDAFAAAALDPGPFGGREHRLALLGRALGAVPTEERVVLVNHPIARDPRIPLLRDLGVFRSPGWAGRDASAFRVRRERLAGEACVIVERRSGRASRVEVHVDSLVRLGPPDASVVGGAGGGSVAALSSAAPPGAARGPAPEPLAIARATAILAALGAGAGDARADVETVLIPLDPEGAFRLVATRAPGAAGSVALVPGLRTDLPPAAERELALLDGIEAYHLYYDLAERTIGVTPPERSVALAFARADREIGRTGRRLAAVGGSDSHGRWLFGTTWVRAADRTRAAIVDAVREGRTVAGGPEACAFAARGDGGDGLWHGPGSDLEAAKRVELAWRGWADLYVDGEFAGRMRGGFVHPLRRPGEFHFYRIVAGGGSSYSGWVYANRPGRAGAAVAAGRGRR